MSENEAQRAQEIRTQFEEWNESEIGPGLDLERYTNHHDLEGEYCGERTQCAYEGYTAGATAARKQLSAWMIANSFATGHGDTLADLLDELLGQIKELRDKSAAGDVRATEMVPQCRKGNHTYCNIIGHPPACHCLCQKQEFAVWPNSYAASNLDSVPSSSSVAQRARGKEKS